jgi:predicted ATP-grasp superfamily ATP-dependent carboligase
VPDAAPAAAGLRWRAAVTTPALVLKFDRNVMHHGGLGAIRSLGRLGVPVYGMHEARLAPAASSRYLAGRIFWRPDASDPQRAVAGLRWLARRIGQPAVLIAADDAGAIFLAEHGALLREEFLFPAPPAGLPRRLAGKWSLQQLCRELNVPAPATVAVTGLPAARRFAAEAGFPLAAKLAAPWQPGAPVRSTSLIRSGRELEAVVSACQRAGATLLLQEFIPPSPGCDWFAHAYRGQGCELIFTGVKLRSYPAHAGLTSLGRAVPSPPLRQQVSSLLARLGYQGIADLDLRYDHRDGTCKLLDFNPRLGAQFRLFHDSAGIDVVRAAYLDLTGQQVPAGAHPDGRRFLVESYDPLAVFGYWRSGDLSPAQWLASVRGAEETAWFARDDVAPFALMCLRMAAHAVTRPLTARLPSRPAPGPRLPRYRPGRAGAGLPSRTASSPPRQQPGRARRGISMTGAVDVAIVGAGPYGLSVAAHLGARGISVREFGLPMHPWRTAMPAGMFLKSQGFASNLSDPAGTHTLEAFCKATGRRYASYGLPVPLATFIAYGEWFQRELVPGVEQAAVSRLLPVDGGWELTLATGETARARQVVVAAGIEHFGYVPDVLAGLPPELCTHASQHTDLSRFSGRSVIVAGGGQSALESAALLHEHGADVQIVMRKAAVAWNSVPLDPARPLHRRLREPESGLGSGWGTWFYSTRPGLFRLLPGSIRVQRARTALGPAGASWLRPRVEGKIPVRTGCHLQWAKPDGDLVRLGVATADGGFAELSASHLIAATGYRADLRRLPFLGPELRAALKTVAGTPAVDAGYESSLPGLYFTGPAVAPTMGPVMRFVYGTGHAARTIAARVSRSLPARQHAAAGR